MARCEFCGGLGRVAPGGITSQLGAMFGSEVHPCGHCHGTGQSGAEIGAALSAPRTAPPGAGLIAMLPGEWLVEIHGAGRILAVLGFVLTQHGTARRFEARSDYGGLLDWRADGEWTCPPTGNAIGFTGTQSSPYLLTTDYRWGATLDGRGRDVLHGRSVANEWTRWSRTADLEPEVPAASSQLVRTR
jgi:hypothetical protein